MNSQYGDAVLLFLQLADSMCCKFNANEPWRYSEVFYAPEYGFPSRWELIRDGLPYITVPDYVDENVSTKVIRIIQFYTGVVNKMVWHEIGLWWPGVRQTWVY